MRALIEVISMCREATGRGRLMTEAQLMDTLAHLARECWLRLEDAGVCRLPDLAESVAMAPEVDQETVDA